MVKYFPCEMGIQTSEFVGFPNSVMADFYSVKTHENFVIHSVTIKATSRWLLGFTVCNDEPHEESASPLFSSIFQQLIINTVITTVCYVITYPLSRENAIF